MQTLRFILFILGSIAYLATAFFAITAWFRLHVMQKKVCSMAETLSHLFGVTMSNHVQSQFNRCQEMKKKLQKLVGNEQYEDAQRLKVVIEMVEKDALKSLQSLKALFGDSIIEVNLSDFH